MAGRAARLRCLQRRQRRDHACDHGAGRCRFWPVARLVNLGGLFQRASIITGFGWVTAFPAQALHHDIEVMDETGKVLTRRRLPEGAAGIAQLHELIGGLVGEDTDDAEVLVGIETDRGPWPSAQAPLRQGRRSSALVMTADGMVRAREHPDPAIPVPCWRAA
jgi:hypothetical protein